MAKPKIPKLHLSLIISSLQICRPKNPFSMIKGPQPPPNPKTFDISFPATPFPPPSKVAPLQPSSDDDDLDWRVPSSRNDTTKKHKNTKQHMPKSCNSEFSSQERGKKLARRRFKRYGSREWKEGEEECSERKPMLERPVADHGRSFVVVVKKSVDPYEDFKKSMAEMVAAERIVEPREMEQLLMSFLSLNSRMHHKVIIQAFTQIFKEMV